MSIECLPISNRTLPSSARTSPSQTNPYAQDASFFLLLLLLLLLLPSLLFCFSQDSPGLLSALQVPVYDLEHVPKVVGPALGPFFGYWGNQDYATVIHCLITAFSQHAVATYLSPTPPKPQWRKVHKKKRYGQQTLNKEMYHAFCVEMMARTAIAAKPTVGT
jgi:hypothetical protein